MPGLDYIEEVHTLHQRARMAFNRLGLVVTIGAGVPLHQPGKSKAFSFSELKYSQINPIIAWIEAQEGEP